MKNTNVTNTDIDNPDYWFMLALEFLHLAQNVNRHGVESFDSYGLRGMHKCPQSIQTEYYKEARRCLLYGLQLQKKTIYF